MTNQLMHLRILQAQEPSGRAKATAFYRNALTGGFCVCQKCRDKREKAEEIWAWERLRSEAT